MRNIPVAIGLDLGTGGARALALDLAGNIVASARADLPSSAFQTHGPRVEQNPSAWTHAAVEALQGVMSHAGPAREVVGISVDATSGTFLLVDNGNSPLTPGIMYNDMRAAEQAPVCASALKGALSRYGIEVTASFALPKIMHLLAERPRLRPKCARVLHQTDWINLLLCGEHGATDVSTALKTGADVGRMRWPEELALLGVPMDWLPRLVLPGEKIGEITRAASAETGLPAGTPVYAGCTDGTAGCLASGASKPGDLNVTLGSTLVFKGIASRPLMDATGAIYNHRHPSGCYLPGAASSTGGEWVGKVLGPQADINRLAQKAAALLPTCHCVYPLVKAGERFPFLCAAARGFGFENIERETEKFAAGMEGVAYLERMGIERFVELGFPSAETIYATGRAVAGQTWLRIRASVTGRRYAVPENPECAVGAAVLAAAPRLGGVEESAKRLVRIARTVAPEPHLVSQYEERYREFREELRRRGFL